MEDYRNHVIEALQMLASVRNIIFTQIVNIASVGELKEILSVFEEGDSYVFDMDQFENSSDANIIKLMELCKKIENTFESIQNINAVKDEEISLSACDNEK